MLPLPKVYDKDCGKLWLQKLMLPCFRNDALNTETCSVTEDNDNIKISHINIKILCVEIDLILPGWGRTAWNEIINHWIACRDQG